MFLNAVILAMREIRRNLLRAILTTLGIVIGVGAVIAIVTLGSGATAGVSETIASLGRNLIILQTGTRRGPGGGGAAIDAPPFDIADADAIKRDIGGLRAVAAVVLRAAVVVAGNQNHPTQVIGTDNAYVGVRDWPVAQGRIFTDAEMRAGRPSCILGQTVERLIFGAQDPLGAEIRVSQIPCEVVGVLSPKGQSTFGQDQDDVVVMPLRTVQRRLSGNTDVGSIWISAERAEDIPKLKDDIERLMRERRHIGEGVAADFSVNDMQEIAAIMQSTAGILTAFLAAIGAISLLVGGIGIMNIMLVSVTERTREIGIRLAIGARERDVLTQFLIEAVMMAVFGGLIGIVVGLGVSVIGTYALDVPFTFSPVVVLLAFAFSALIGIAFGFFPARRAARLDPIEALRHE
jgi:putative ABC transport system permease protein